MTQQGNLLYVELTLAAINHWNAQKLQRTPGPHIPLHERVNVLNSPPSSKMNHRSGSDGLESDKCSSSSNKESSDEEIEDSSD